ncbi:MAG TPA: hypothetical protein PLK90_01170 [Clostridiales bacterium]|jgi:predicted nucleotidyltransferase|nr:hypothetical protein [Clostridiales bacterium]HQP68988.1 hypothetical protein [Clostridiales bacterium]
MKNSLPKNSNNFDPEFLECIRTLGLVSESLKIQLMLIGASARDILFEYINNIKAPRNTLDLDIAVQIENWRNYDMIKAKLREDYGFETTETDHKLKYKNMFIDIVPCGKLADNNSLVWRDSLKQMDVTGFKEVFKHSIMVSLCDDPVTEVRVPSIEGLTLLKIISWKDAYPGRPKDAEDILFILKSYERTISADLMFDKYSNILEKEGFDPVQAGAVILGKRIKEICLKSTLNSLNLILIAEISDDCQYSLIIQMKNDFTESRKLLSKLYEGLNSI